MLAESKMKPGSRKRVRLTLGIGAVLLLGGFVFIRWGNSIAVALENDKPSHSTENTKDGRLINGKRLPTCGPNFAAYGRLPAAFGRNSLNDRVRTVVLDAYAMLEQSHPSAHFLYGECSWPSGGRLLPHATHRNGLSIDFLVPVRKSGEPSVIHTSIFNKYGYGLEFDQNGCCSAQSCHLDAETMAAHLLALYQAAANRGMKIRRVIFAPELQTFLLHTRLGSDVEKTVPFSKDRPWVRHDEHYHVDFENPDETQADQKFPPPPPRAPLAGRPEGARAMREYLTGKDPKDVSVNWVKAHFGEPHSQTSTSLVYIFDTGLGGNKWEFQLEGGKVKRVIHQSLE